MNVFSRVVLILFAVTCASCGGSGGESVFPDAQSAADVGFVPDDAGEQPAPDAESVPDVTTSSSDNELERPLLVIVAPDDLAAAYEPLAAWRNSRGVSTRVVSLSEVTAGFEGSDVQERLRNAIRAWQGESARYVLLGGDHPMLPRREVHCEAYNAPEDAELDDDVAAEMYYSDLDGDWDADGDGRYGELEDEVDFFPDIAVGRVPARNVVEVANYIAKVRAYEDPDEAAYLGRVAFLGEYAGEFGSGSVCSTILLETFKAFIPADIDLTRYYATECGDYEGAVPNTTTAQQRMWNDGVGLVLDLGHGDWYTMGMLTNHSVSGLSNAERPGVYLTCECNGCEFDYEDADHAACETFLVSTGGGVLYVGNTDFGVGVPWESAFYRLLLEHLYENPGLRAGDLYTHAVGNYAEGQWAGLEAYPYDLRWTQLTLTLMGDPSIRLWTGEPAPADVSVSESGDELVVSVTNGDALVALYGADRFLYTAEVEEGGSARFPIPESPYQLTVTGPRLLPWTETR